MEYRDGSRRTDADSLKYTDLPVGSELRPSHLTLANSRLSTRKSIYFAIPHPLSPSVQLIAGKLFPGGCRHLRVPDCGVYVLLCRSAPQNPGNPASTFRLLFETASFEASGG